MGHGMADAATEVDEEEEEGDEANWKQPEFVREEILQDTQREWDFNQANWNKNPLAANLDLEYHYGKSNESRARRH